MSIFITFYALIGLSCCVDIADVELAAGAGGWPLVVAEAAAVVEALDAADRFLPSPR